MPSQASLFSRKLPLAELIRPRSISEIVGEHSTVNDSDTASLILWGPPGVGKTSLAKILARNSKRTAIETSAVSTAGTEFKDILRSTDNGSEVLLLIDEIHHLNKSQQDIFLPYLEDGRVRIIGTTTENPSFELRAALLSRCKVIVFSRLSVDDMRVLIQRAEQFAGHIPLDPESRELLAKMADGDGRYLVNRLEEILSVEMKQDMGCEEMMHFITNRPQVYDKSGEEHYNLISALHKSMRGSDVDAALYWFARMLEGGEDPLYIARRVIRFASEDVGMADPEALHQALAAREVYSVLGSPEGELAIAQAIIYVSTAPKSNSIYTAYNQARVSAKRTGSLPPPKHIRNAPTEFMKEQGYGKGYMYDHDAKNAFSGQNYFPMKREYYYKPVERGFEREIRRRMDWWKKIRNSNGNSEE